MKEFVWRKRALRSVRETAAYIEEVLGSPQAARNFVESVYETIEWVCKYPTIGMPAKKRKTIRSWKIDKHRRLYYSVKGKKLYVVDIFDHRQDPEKSRY